MIKINLNNTYTLKIKLVGIVTWHIYLWIFLKHRQTYVYCLLVDNSISNWFTGINLILFSHDGQQYDLPIYALFSKLKYILFKGTSIGVDFNFKISV